MCISQESEADDGTEMIIAAICKPDPLSVVAYIYHE